MGAAGSAGCHFVLPPDQDLGRRSKARTTPARTENNCLIGERRWRRSPRPPSCRKAAGWATFSPSRGMGLPAPSRRSGFRARGLTTGYRNSRDRPCCRGVSYGPIITDRRCGKTTVMPTAPAAPARSTIEYRIENVTSPNERNISGEWVQGDVVGDFSVTLNQESQPILRVAPTRSIHWRHRRADFRSRPISH